VGRALGGVYASAFAALPGAGAVLAPLFWFFGVHGDRIANEFLGHELLKATFIPTSPWPSSAVWGSEAGLSLLLALRLFLQKPPA